MVRIASLGVAPGLPTSSKWKSALFDPSTVLLLFSNLSTIFFAVTLGWSLLTLMWIYWIQSVIIGIFNFFRILSLKDFSTKGFYIGGRPVSSTASSKVITAVFFAFHYGFFHFGYMIFLLAFSFAGSEIGLGAFNFSDMGYVAFVAALFFANHLFSFLHNLSRDQKKQNIGRLMMFPYFRIVPMHLTIIFGLMLGPAAIILFLLLKTGSDLGMHLVEHS